MRIGETKTQIDRASQIKRTSKMDSSTCSDNSTVTTRAMRAVVHERENSRDELEALFNPTKWSQQSKVPFARRNLPSSFFNPPPTGTKTPNSRSNSTAASLNSSACHSRQNSVDELNLSQQSARQQQQHVILNQKLKSLAQLQSNSQHSRSSSEPVNMLPCAFSRHQQQQRLLQPVSSKTPSNLGAQHSNHQHLNNGGHLSPQLFHQPVNPPDPQQFPPGWRAAHTSDGRPYYVNVLTNETSWQLPQQPTSQVFPQQPHQYNQPLQPQPAAPMPLNDDPMDLNDPKKVEQLLEQIPMPQGWERTQTKSGQFYFINHNTKTTCWEDPRMPMLPSYLKTLRGGQQQEQHNFNQVPNPMAYQPQPFQNNEQLKASLLEIVQKRMDLIKTLEEINKQEVYLKNQINVAIGDSSANSPIDPSWNPNSSYTSHSIPVLPANHGHDSFGQHFAPNEQPASMHRREQSIELEHVSNMYNKMLINNTNHAGYSATADPAMVQSVTASNHYDPLQENKSQIISLLSPDLDTDSIDDYSLSSSSTTSLLNINL